MSDLKDVSPINLFSGMTVLSLSSGNKLGQVLELFIDPINGVLVGLTLSLSDGRIAGLTENEIHSFGRDAVMARGDQSIIPLDSGQLAIGQQASKLIGTNIITESGDVIGNITDVFVTLKPPPHILYEVRQSLLDKLLGREFFVPASVGHALSDDATRLVVPDATMEIADSDLSNLVEQGIEVRTFDPSSERARPQVRDDDTIPVVFQEDETIVRMRDEDETVVRLRDDDDTVVRQPRRSTS